MANVDAKKSLAPEGPLKAILPASKNNQDDPKLIAKSTNSGETSTFPPIKPNTPELSEADIAAFNSQVETAKKWGEMIPDRLKNVFNQAMEGLSGDVSSNPPKAPQGDGGLVGQMIRSTGKAFLESPLNRFIDSAALGVNRNILDPLTKNPEIAAGFAVAASGFLGPTVATLATGIGLFSAGSLVVKGGINLIGGVFNGNPGKVDEGIGDVFSGGIPFLMGRSPKAQNVGQLKGTKAPSLPEIKALNEPLPSPVSSKVVDPGLPEMTLLPSSASRPGMGRSMSGNTGDLKIGSFPGGGGNGEFLPGRPLSENTLSFPPRPGDSSGFNLVNPAPASNPTNRIVLMPTNSTPASPTVPRMTGLTSETVESLSVVGTGGGPSASGGITPQLLVNPGVRPSGQSFRLPQEVTIPGRVLPGETLPLNPMELPGGVPGVAPKLSPAVQPMFQPVKPAGKSLAPEDAPNFTPALPPGEIPIKSPSPGGNPGSVKPGETLVNKPTMFPEQPGALKSGNTEPNLPGIRPEIKNKPENFPGDIKLPGMIPPAGPSLPSKENPSKLPSFPFIQPGDPTTSPSSKELDSKTDTSTLPLPNSPEMMGPKPIPPKDKNLENDKNLNRVWPVLKPKPESPVTQEQLTFAQQHLDKGIELIKSGKYNEALVHFLDKNAAQKSGARLDSNLIIRTLRNQSDLESIIDEAASSSWYTAGRQSIKIPEAGMLNEAQNPQMARILSRENAFLALEEFSHHIQNVTGSPISQAGVRHLGPFLNNELDVAQFMKEQGLEPSDRFLSRYSQRSLVANSTAMRSIVNGIGLGDDIRVGRREDLPSAPIFQDDPKVSREHLMMIRVQTGELFAQNLSKNGTQVNGQLLTKPTPLKKGDLVKIGNSFFLIE
ncbi:MAG: FHA domain-containing protein [Cyanobacteria bacterium]|nr:FHA domain-containing protein [Cyanobacteriota bacterium]